MKGRAQNRFLAFSADIAREDTSAVKNFMRAAQGMADLDDLMGTMEKLNSVDRKAFLKLAAGSDMLTPRLTATLEKLGPGSIPASNFLSAAAASGSQLEGLIDLVERHSGEVRTDLLEFTSDLSYVDLAGYIRAALKPGADAHALAETAQDLGDRQKHHFLYAASIDNTASDLLMSLTQELDGSVLDDFLYTAANKAAGLAGFLVTAQEMGGNDRAAFITSERELLETEKDSAQAYVFLKSVFDQDLFRAITDTEDNMEMLLEKMNVMDASQMDAFISLANQVGNNTAGPMAELLDITRKLHGDDLDAFTETAGSLGGTALTNFILFADAVTAETPDRENDRLDRLMDLKPHFGDFLSTSMAVRDAGIKLNKLVCPVGCELTEEGRRVSAQLAKAF